MNGWNLCGDLRGEAQRRKRRCCAEKGATTENWEIAEAGVGETREFGGGGMHARRRQVDVAMRASGMMGGGTGSAEELSLEARRGEGEQDTAASSDGSPLRGGGDAVSSGWYRAQARSHGAHDSAAAHRIRESVPHHSPNTPPLLPHRPPIAPTLLPPFLLMRQHLLAHAISLFHNYRTRLPLSTSSPLPSCAFLAAPGNGFTGEIAFAAEQVRRAQKERGAVMRGDGGDAGGTGQGRRGEEGAECIWGGSGGDRGVGGGGAGGSGRRRGMGESGGGGFAASAVAAGKGGACAPVPIPIRSLAPISLRQHKPRYAIAAPLLPSPRLPQLRTRQPHHAGRAFRTPGPRHSPLHLRFPGCPHARSLCGHCSQRPSTHSALQGRPVAATAAGVVRRISLSIPQQPQQPLRVLVEASLPLSRCRPSFSFPVPVARQTPPPPSPTTIPLVPPAHSPSPCRHAPPSRHAPPCRASPAGEGAPQGRAAAFSAPWLRVCFSNPLSPAPLLSSHLPSPSLPHSLPFLPASPSSRFSMSRLQLFALPASPLCAAARPSEPSGIRACLPPAPSWDRFVWAPQAPGAKEGQSEGGAPCISPSAARLARTSSISSSAAWPPYAAALGGNTGGSTGGSMGVGGSGGDGGQLGGGGCEGSSSGGETGALGHGGIPQVPRGVLTPSSLTPPGCETEYMGERGTSLTCNGWFPHDT
ncbi:unnamed protein product [Closterium sp. Naga37s-1]|nr:unnamed protein product [Closterium sp. Naga37s-1]